MSVTSLSTSDVTLQEEEVGELDRAIDELRSTVPRLTERKENISRKVEDCRRALAEANTAVQDKIAERDELRVRAGVPATPPLSRALITNSHRRHRAP